MNAKDSVRMALVLIPILGSTTQFGLALVCGFGFLLLIILGQTVSVFVGSRFPERFRVVFLALIVGTLYTVIAEVLRIFDPGIVLVLSFGLPMTAFAAFLLLANEPRKDLEDTTDRMTWALVQGSTGFFVIVPLGFLLEILGTGRLSISLADPIQIFAIGADAQSGPILLALAPAGVFFLAGLIFLVVNLLRKKEQEENKNWES